MWHNGLGTSGFEAIFSPIQTGFSGWPDETHFFGTLITAWNPGEVRTFSTELNQVDMCIDGDTTGPQDDFTNFRFTEITGT